ncbi:hypothetical protein [Streptomyces sp. NPDC054794]
MGSLRNPVGPLPSSIYWRRRVIMLSAVAVSALLIAWIATAGGGGGKKNADGSNGKNPLPSITPGSSGSGPAYSQHPGGRDESSGGGSGGDTGTGDGGSGATDGSGSDDGSGSGSGSGGVAAGDVLPASSALPNCTAGSVTLSLRSRHNSYSPDQSPAFELIAKNTSGSDCKVDLGPKRTVLTITQADGDDDFFSSADCPKTSGSLLFRVPADGSITYTVTWDRKPSAPECATPPAGSAKAGTYLVEAKAPGFAKAQTSFVLSAD